MQIQINTGPNINANEGLIGEISGVVEGALSRFSDHITRVEVHLSDQNSDKKVGHEDMRCMLEARLAGVQPIAVTHQATSLDLAVSGAAGKLARLIERAIGRRNKKRTRRTGPDLSVPEPEPEERS
jgi:ribosome-associated translation inhibitor RaiA